MRQKCVCSIAFSSLISQVEFTFFYYLCLLTVLVHDNACKFAAFVKNRKELSPIMSHLASLDYRVDRHHYKNHIGATCKKNNNPDDCELLDGVNTSVMEQVNAWFGRYRHSARYMNAPRFNLYLLLACHLNNRFRVYKRVAFANEEEECGDNPEELLYN